MNRSALYLVILTAGILLCPAVAPAQVATPQENGLIPKTDTIYINGPGTVNNLSTESTGVAIAANGNVIVGWEDDGSTVFDDLEAVWTLFDGQGSWITPDTQITSLQEAGSITTKFLSYFRSNGSATPASTAWGPKIKANLFGDGIGMGATAFSLGLEIPELADINIDAGGGGDFPAVQLLDNLGQPIAVLSGLSDADAEPEGDVRIADWEYLANGNLVIVGENRQQQDLVDRFGGSAPANHTVYRILDSSGAEVRGLNLLSEAKVGSGMWHGVGVTQNGFAARYELGGRQTVRIFDNDGNPVSGDIDIATLTGEPNTAQGGRGDSAGFHGNGKDAYVIANTGGGQPWVTVLNADGSLRWFRNAVAEFPEMTSDRIDAAIDAQGRVIVAFGDPTGHELVGIGLVRARVFDPAGEPVADPFFVSEREDPTNPLVDEARRPRLAWRGRTVAILWESRNDPTNPNYDWEVTLRLFEAAVSETVLEITGGGTQVTLTWEGGGNLEQAASPGGAWNAVVGAVSPHTMTATAGQAFFRVR